MRQRRVGRASRALRGGEVKLMRPTPDRTGQAMGRYHLARVS